MSEISLYRRGAFVETISATPGDLVFTELIANHIPPASAIIIRDDRPVSVFTPVASDAEYEAHILEGYDVQSCREFHATRADDGAVYTDRRFAFDERGQVAPVVRHLQRNEFEHFLEDRVEGTMAHYGLAKSDDRLLVALSGEGDSSAMLRILRRIQDEWGFDLEAVTMQEPRGSESGSFEHATELTSELDVPHRTVELAELSELFDLSMPVREAFDRIERREDGHDIITVLETVHWRVFEHVAEEGDFDRVCLGAHLTEFVAGVLNAVVSGTQSELSGVPERRVGPFEFVYPVALCDKSELATYTLLRDGSLPRTSEHNSWEAMPSERGFLYYFADMLRTYWPGIGHRLIETTLVGDESGEDFVRCEHCGKYRRHTRSGDVCVACEAFSAVDAI